MPVFPFPVDGLVNPDEPHLPAFPFPVGGLVNYGRSVGDWCALILIRLAFPFPVIGLVD